ncbi:MAG: DNA polymerase domain-containing protein [Candidatus Micrarchaeales archaeon]
MESMELEGIIIYADYAVRKGRGMIRLTFKSKDNIYYLADTKFLPYFYLIPSNLDLDPKSLLDITTLSETNEEAKANAVERTSLIVAGKEMFAFKIILDNPRFVPRLSKLFEEFGTVYEKDIVFWKRYLIDKKLSPLAPVKVSFHAEEDIFVIDSIENFNGTSEKLTCICFDIETYNPLGAPRDDKDAILMISYTDGTEYKVLTTKKINRDFVVAYDTEKEMLQGFVDVVKRIDPDILSGYNSSNFDIPYLMKRSARAKVTFDIGRYNGEEPKSEHHGLVEAVRIPGRINLDIYNVARFVSIVGASEKVIKVNSFKLFEVYRAITGKEKKMVEKGEIWQLWDKEGADLEELTDYSLADSLSLKELYDFFLPLEVEVARVAGTLLGEAAVSTTSQLVEFMLMRYAYTNHQMIPNKPEKDEIDNRTANPYEGAYVKMPDPGIYDKMAVFDFRGLYPSIIIAHNIDPSTMCDDCTDYYESPTGTRFRKDRVGIMPLVLRLLIDERSEVKKAFKKDPDNKGLAARQTALKILANAFYGYLGYPRSRWYSRQCASSVTSYARFFITKTIDEAENAGFKVLYGDSIGKDSLVRIKFDENNECHDQKIEELFLKKDKVGEMGKEYHFPKKTSIETIDEEGRVVFRKVNYVMRHKTQKKMYRVWFTNVQYIDVTEDHSLIGYGNLSKFPNKDVMDRLIEIKPTELRKRVYSLVTKKVSARGKIENRGYDKKLYELMGFFIGDGSFYFGHYKGKRTKRYYLGIAAGDDEEEIYRGLLLPLKKKGIIKHILNKGRGDFAINGLPLVRLFEREVLQEDKKAIPEFMFRESKENISSFLSGLFSSDGTVMVRNKKPIIRYTTIDKGLAEQIKKLLWEYGVSSSIFKENNQNKYDGKETGTYSYHVVIKSKDVFIRDIGFIVKRKNRIISTYKETSLQKRKIIKMDFDISSAKRIETIHYDDYVYDIEVSGVHRFFADGVLVHNTDSIFLIMGDKTKDDVNIFLKGVNKSLPNTMELELEDFYTRGVFVGKRGGEGGAKKKYALMSESGRIKIRGFELVRRDWAKIARDTQLAVLEAILKEGSKEKAVNIVKDVVERLQSGTVELKDLVMNTQLRKGIGSYDIKSPELTAAKKALEQGVKKKSELEGTTIGYIITKHGSSISEKAEIWETAKDYDPDYYIDHQIIPATLKILKELGYNADELKMKGSQKKLG